tara:strand:+ start:104 stop:514 length:411 start_codon:yes stop_codon:yes gene_type:complete
MKRMMVFHASGVDSSSVGSHDAGTNLDLAAFDVADLKCMTGTEDTVELTFNETGMFNSGYNGGADNEALEQSLVILTVGEGKEFDVIKDIAALVNNVAVNGVAAPVFDAVNSKYPINNVTAIAIRRTTTSRAVTAA